MNISGNKQGSIDIVQPQGRLDATTVAGLEQHLNGLIETGSRRLALDLSQLEYVSSAGLRVFLAAAKRLQKANGKLILAAPTQQVRQLFEIAGLAGVLPVYDSMDAITTE